jgi:alpha-galactosidase
MEKKYRPYRPLIFFLLFMMIMFSFGSTEESIKFSKKGEKVLFESEHIRFELDQKMGTRVYSKIGDRLLSMISPGSPGYFIVINGVAVKDFVLDPQKTVLTMINTPPGNGKKLQMRGYAKGPLGSVIEKEFTVELFDQYPNAGLVSVQYRNINKTAGLTIENEVDASFRLDASLLDAGYGKHDFWLLQGGSYRSRPDWIMPVSDTLSYENYMGKDEKTGNSGGGLPVLDVWNLEGGLFIGSIRNKPTLVSLPVKVDQTGYLNIGIEYKRNTPFAGETYKTIPTVIGVHQGDYYNGLATYAAIMADRGLKMLETDPTDQVYDADWCGWGLGPDFTQQQMTGMIPTLEELHFNTVTMDDGWFESYGDFVLKSSIFPGGDADAAKFTATFHAKGFPVKLWFTPAVGGAITMEKHPEWFIRDKSGEMVTVDRFGVRRTAAFLCPTLPEVQNYYREMVNLVLGRWGFDGFKMDFEIINAMGECYAKDHGHSSPTESFEALPELFKVISDESRKIKPKAILEICPCGMFPSFYKMPYYNQSVASDPTNTWQIRHRGKTLKALMGPRSAYYGDHVERFYSKNNFASMVGVGGIPGSKFVAIETDDGFLGKKYPVYLDQGRKENFETWLKVYKDNRLSTGEYLNLYDIAYDKPETHVIKKEGTLYYAFYAEEWSGEIEFRGLANIEYEIIDYVNDKQIGKIKGGKKLKTQFDNYLLVKAIPAE